MTALQWIVKEAKEIKKKYPKRFSKWTEYVAQASAIYASKHKGKSPVGKKKAAPKKAAKKKAAPKKAAKKKIGYSKIRLKQEKGITNVLRSTPKTTKYYTEEEKIIKAGKRYFDKKDRELVSKGVYGVKKKSATKKRKPIKEQSILNKIHKVKDQVNQLDELQHKHMIGSIDKYKNTMKEVKLYDAALKKITDNFKGLTPGEKLRVKRVKKKLIDARNELKTHAAQLKKHI